MNKAEIVLYMPLIPYGQTTEVTEPCEQSLDFPASSVVPQLVSILGLGFLSVPPVGCNHLDALLSQLCMQQVTVVSSVADDPFGRVGSENPFQGLLLRTSTCDAYGDWKTSAVCHCHEVRNFAPLGLSHPSPPFLAAMKVPSIKHSLTSNLSRSLRSRAMARKIFSIMPSHTHFRKRRWQVWYGVYRSGKSCHWASVRRIHSTPSISSRALRHDAPRVARDIRSFLGISGSIKSHCSSVRFITTSSVLVGRKITTLLIYEIASNYIKEIGTSKLHTSVDLC